MNEINLDEAKINVESEWYSVEDLKKSIQEKMASGEMKFAGLATALEELNKALENSHTLEIKIVINKDEYQKLKALGGDDDREAVRKAVMASIGAKEKVKSAIKCPSCKAPIKITTDERPIVVECSNCGVSGRLTEKNKWVKLNA
ncbi:hypothetical protein ACFL0M_00480 [Thermodesulfobacteriota bacterium]